MDGCLVLLQPILMLGIHTTPCRWRTGSIRCGTQTYVASHLVLLVGIRRQAIQALMSHSRGNIIPPAVRTVDWQCCAVSDVDAL